MSIAQQQFSALIDDLKSSHGDNLASVILYGSAAAGDFLTNSSDYNLLITLKQIRPKDLRAAQAPMREWKRLGHPLPVYFTLDELENAGDVFPIEFHQMRQARIVLYGTDVLATVDISDAFLRHQTEYELRSKLLQLRRLYIPTSVSLDNLKNLMSESLVSFAALFRAVLILHRVDAPVTKREIVDATVKKLGLNAAPFDSIFGFREENASKFDDVSANELFGEYLEQIEKVIDSVDKIKKS